MIKGGHNRRGAYFRMTYIVGYPLYYSIYILEEEEKSFTVVAIYSVRNSGSLIRYLLWLESSCTYDKSDRRDMVLEKIIGHKEVNFTKISYLCNAIRAPCCLGK